MSAPRLAVVTPYSSVVFLRRLREAGVDSAWIRERAGWLRSHGFPGQAGELESSWAQLMAAAADVQAPSSASSGADSGTAQAEPRPAARRSTHVGTEEAAQLLGVSARWVRQLIEAGGLKAERSGLRGSWIIERAAVEELATLRQGA